MVLNDKYPKASVFWRALLVCTSCILSEQELAMGMLLMTQTIMLFTLYPVIFKVHVLTELLT